MKPEKNISSPWDFDVQENNIGEPVKISGDNPPYPYTSSLINFPRQSNWTCYLFGGDESYCGIQWTPIDGKVPNVWVRFWMKVFLGCKWVKND